jgi:hypothetical protein
MDKFLLASNPMREGSGEYIIHTLDPVAIIKCAKGHIHGEGYRAHVQFRDKHDQLQEWTLSVQFIDDGGDTNHVVSRAWRWFRSYLETQTSTQ